MTYIIEVWVSGGVTGSRTSFLKSNGELSRFEDKSLAEEAAKELRDRKMNCNHGARVLAEP